MSLFRTTLLIAASAVLLSAAPQTFGKPLTLKDADEVKIADLVANPDKYNGQKVRVRGVVTWVCEKRGGTIRLAASKKEIPFKVPHDVIVFPVSIKGRRAVAEGVWTVRKLSVEDQVKEAKEHDHKVDAKTLKPRTMMHIDGTEGGVELVP